MTRSRAVLIGCLIFAATAFAMGISWGLPTRAFDPYLFGSGPTWTGPQIANLTGGRGHDQLGADVDRNPLSVQGQGQILNADDAARAAILLRYRLYSAQPDEMITFMALAGMQPRQGQLDPKLYQYGGLWVYGVGGLLGAAKLLGMIELRGDLAFYLDRPEAFSRFYVVARAYSAAWGVVGAAAVWWLTRRLGRSILPAALATIGYALLPVVINMAHEAKPHLPAAAIMLLACVAATKFVETGRRRWWIATAVLCGASVGMILSAWPVVFVVPAMLLARPSPRSQRILVAVTCGIIAIDVYLLTNPYVLKHAMAWNQTDNPLRSNLQNSSAMYRAGLSMQGATDAIRLFGYATTPVVAVMGLVGLTGIFFVRRQADPPDSAPAEEWLAVLLLVPSVIILGQFTLLAAGKPGEYARFALFPSIALLIFTVAGLWRLGRGSWLSVAVIALVLCRVGVGGSSYAWHFINDAGTRPSRLVAADRLRRILPPGATLGVLAEPAPYSIPPVNLFDTRIVLRPEAGSEVDAAIVAVDDPSRPPPGEWNTVWVRPRLLPTPISWAGKTWLLRLPPSATRPSDG
jgi:hypothetical protein